MQRSSLIIFCVLLPSISCLSQPEFDSPGILWNKLELVSTLDLSSSPFNRYQWSIVKLVENYIGNRQTEEALKLLKRVIRMEKAWRLQQCIVFFGEKSCERESTSPRPFYLWKKRMIHLLLKDPTDEIIATVREKIVL